MSVPFVKLFQGVDYPILTANDLASGMWRGVYETTRGRPVSTVVGHVISQTAGSAVGRMVDTQDDRLGFDALKGNSMIVTAVAGGLVTGGLDWAMNRGSKMERFVVPTLVNAAVELAGPMLYNNNPRIL